MKKALRKTKNRCWYFLDGKEIDGCHDRLSGDVTGLRGDVDDCNLSGYERAKGIDVADLIG